MLLTMLSRRQNVAMRWTAHRESVNMPIGWMMEKVLQKQVASKIAMNTAPMEECVQSRRAISKRNVDNTFDC